MWTIYDFDSTKTNAQWMGLKMATEGCNYQISVAPKDEEQHIITCLGILSITELIN